MRYEIIDARRVGDVCGAVAWDCTVMKDTELFDNIRVSMRGGRMQIPTCMTPDLVEQVWELWLDEQPTGAQS